MGELDIIKKYTSMSFEEFDRELNKENFLSTIVNDRGDTFLMELVCTNQYRTVRTYWKPS